MGDGEFEDAREGDWGDDASLAETRAAETRAALRAAAESLDVAQLRRLWAAANLAALASFAFIGHYIYSGSSGDGEMIFLALVVGGAFAYLARCAVIYGLGVWRAPSLGAFIIETEVNRRGDSLSVDTDHHVSGDETLDGYIRSYVEARERILKIGSWVMVLVFFGVIMLLASAFGVVDVVW